MLLERWCAEERLERYLAVNAAVEDVWGRASAFDRAVVVKCDWIARRDFVVRRLWIDDLRSFLLAAIQVAVAHVGQHQTPAALPVRELDRH